MEKIFKVICFIGFICIWVYFVYAVQICPNCSFENEEMDQYCLNCAGQLREMTDKEKADLEKQKEVYKEKFEDDPEYQIDDPRKAVLYIELCNYFDNDIYEEVFDPELKAYRKLLIEKKGLKILGNGSGFYINESGYFVTNYHVVENYIRKNANILVTRYEKYKELKDNWIEKKYLKSEFYFQNFNKVKLISWSKALDIAVLKHMGEKNTPYLRMVSDENKPNVLDELTVVGNPAGIDFVITQGIVSNFLKMKDLREVKNFLKYDVKSNCRITKEEYYETLVIQTDAAINPGNSGGPMINRNNDVVGIASFIFRGNNEGLNFGMFYPSIKLVAKDLCYISKNSSKIKMDEALPALDFSQKKHQLEKLKLLFDEHLITEDEYKAKKLELIESI